MRWRNLTRVRQLLSHLRPFLSHFRQETLRHPLSPAAVKGVEKKLWVYHKIIQDPQVTKDDCDWYPGPDWVRLWRVQPTGPKFCSDLANVWQTPWLQEGSAKKSFSRLSTWRAEIHRKRHFNCRSTYALEPRNWRKTKLHQAANSHWNILKLSSLAVLTSSVARTPRCTGFPQVFPKHQTHRVENLNFPHVQL
jgi:hypothetical protein